jgi:ATP-binding cassette subfamily F protein uup
VAGSDKFIQDVSFVENAVTKYHLPKIIFEVKEVYKKASLEYEKKVAEDAKKAALKAEKVKSMAAPAPAPAQKNKLSYKEQKEIETLEKEIAELESKKIAINEKMLSETGVDELIQLANDLAICTALLDEKEMRLLTLI